MPSILPDNPYSGELTYTMAHFSPLSRVGKSVAGRLSNKEVLRRADGRARILTDMICYFLHKV